MDVEEVREVEALVVWMFELVKDLEAMVVQVQYSPLNNNIVHRA